MTYVSTTFLEGSIVIVFHLCWGYYQADLIFFCNRIFSTPAGYNPCAKFGDFWSICRWPKWGSTSHKNDKSKEMHDNSIWVLAPILYLGCPAERSGCAVVLQSFLAEAKVSEDDVALRVQQDVLRFQVSV